MASVAGADDVVAEGGAVGKAFWIRRSRCVNDEIPKSSTYCSIFDSDSRAEFLGSHDHVQQKGDSGGSFSRHFLLSSPIRPCTPTP